MPRGLAACIAARAGLDQLSRERVRMEMLKLLLAPHAVPALAVDERRRACSIAVLGGVPLLGELRQHDQARSARWRWRPIRCGGSARSRVRIAEDAERLRERLRLANAEHERLAVDGGRRGGGSRRGDDAEARALLYRLGPENFVDRVLLAWARSRRRARDDPAWRELAQLPERWTAPVFPLKAADFIARGVPKGPALGAALRAAEEAWIAADFPAGPDR